MALRADDLIDRRRLRRKLTFWRIAALVVAALAVRKFGFRTTSHAAWLSYVGGLGVWVLQVRGSLRLARGRS